MYYSIKNVSFDKITPKFILNWKNKIFIQDYMIDIRKYKIKGYEKKDLLKSYETNYILTWIYQVEFLKYTK